MPFDLSSLGRGLSSINRKVSDFSGDLALALESPEKLRQKREQKRFLSDFGDIYSGRSIPEFRRRDLGSPEAIEAQRIRNVQEALLRNPYTASTAIPQLAQQVFAQPKKPSAKDQQIERIMKAYGVPRETAIGVADNVLYVETDPVSKQPMLVNRATGEVQQLDVGRQQSGAKDTTLTQQEQQTESAYKGKTVADYLPDATGIASGVRSAVSSVTGQFGLPIAEETERARTFLKTVQNDLVNATKRNPRNSQGEVDRLLQQFPIEPDWTTPPSVMRQRFIEIKNYAENRLRSAMTDSYDRSLAPDVRSKARESVSALQNVLDKIGDIEGAQGGSEPIIDPATGQVSFGAPTNNAVNLRAKYGLE